VDELDRRIVNALRGGFPVRERPFAEVAARLGCGERELIRRIDALLQAGVLTRFARCTMPSAWGERSASPPWQCLRPISIASRRSSMPSLRSHNYAHDHVLNMWFVLATESAEALQQALAEIEQQTGYAVYNMPKIAEYLAGLRLDA
jgi:siroheme decarboxylase